MLAYTSGGNFFFSIKNRFEIIKVVFCCSPALSTLPSASSLSCPRIQRQATRKTLWAPPCCRPLEWRPPPQPSTRWLPASLFIQVLCGGPQNYLRVAASCHELGSSMVRAFTGLWVLFGGSSENCFLFSSSFWIWIDNNWSPASKLEKCSTVSDPWTTRDF